MLDEYKFVRGKEIETYQDILECEEYGIILCDLVWGNCHYNIDILLRENEILTMDRLQKIKDEGYSIYQRVKKYRDIVFSKDVDNKVSDILINFAQEYEDAYSDQLQTLLQNTLIELKDLITEESNNDTRNYRRIYGD